MISLRGLNDLWHLQIYEGIASAESFGGNIFQEQSGPKEALNQNGSKGHSREKGLANVFTVEDFIKTYVCHCSSAIKFDSVVESLSLFLPVIFSIPLHFKSVNIILSK